jgi:regulator of protease activity HflC (stomatin/prohibitin superfamily)
MSIRSYGREIDESGLAKRAAVMVVSVLVLLALPVFGCNLVEGVDANEVVVIQYPSGGIYVAKVAGWAPQWFGKVSRYAKRGKIDFQPGSDGEPDGRLPIAFNDNGRALLKGSMQYELPLVDDKMIAIHSAYPDEISLQAGLIKPPINKSIFLTGTLMTSYESYKEKRSMLIQYVEDQAQNGVYRTQTLNREVDEEQLGADGLPTIRKKRITENVIVQSNGQPVRNEEGQLARFGVTLFGFAIEDIDYSAEVDKQIDAQQAITMAVQTSMANALKAQQDAVTAEATGRANIATARAGEEIDKTKAVVQGEKAKELARLKAEEAAFYKTEQLLRADADSEYRRRIMAADNALTQRLEAYRYAVDKMATALAAHPLVPSVVMGGGGGGSTSSAQTLVDLLLVNQAKALGVELNPKQ